MVFLNDSFEKKLILKMNEQTTKGMQNYSQNIGPGVVPTCLQRLHVSADDTSRPLVEEYFYAYAMVHVSKSNEMVHFFL